MRPAREDRLRSSLDPKNGHARPGNGTRAAGRQVDWKRQSLGTGAATG